MPGIHSKFWLGDTEYPERVPTGLQTGFRDSTGLLPVERGNGVLGRDSKSFAAVSSRLRLQHIIGYDSSKMTRVIR